MNNGDSTAILSVGQAEQTNTQNGGLPEAEVLSPQTMVETGEQGATGTMITGGIIVGEEYNNKLVGRPGLALYDKMRKSDAAVRASLKFVTLPMLAADRSIEPAGDDPVDTQIKEFVEFNLFQHIHFADFFREALTMLPFGFSVFEKVWNYALYQNRLYIVLEKLAARKQTTIQQWQTLDGKAGIYQFTNTGQTASIDMDRLIVFTHEKEGDNYEGTSILRAAYKHWYMKDNLYRIQAMSIERQGMGIPYVKPPAQSDPKAKAAAEEALRNLRANEAAYIEVPEGYEIGFMNMEARNVINPEVAIEHHNREIMKNVLAQFVELGAGGGGGSYALSADQSRLFVQSLESIVTYFVEIVNEHIIKPLVDYNFNVPPNGYPTFSVGKISDDNIEAISSALQKLATSNLITPDAALEQALRDILHLPALPEEYEKDYNNRPKAVSGATPPTTTQEDNTPDDNSAPTRRSDSEPVKASDMMADITDFRDYLRSIKPDVKYVKTQTRSIPIG